MGCKDNFTPKNVDHSDSTFLSYTNIVPNTYSLSVEFVNANTLYFKTRKV